MTDDESFANAPVTVADLKSEKTNLARDWKPRDMLIKLLRQIDRGELKPEAMIAMWYVPGKNNGAVVPTFMCAGGRGGMDLAGLANKGAALVTQAGPEP